MDKKFLKLRSSKIIWNLSSSGWDSSALSLISLPQAWCTMPRVTRAAPRQSPCRSGRRRLAQGCRKGYCLSAGWTHLWWRIITYPEYPYNSLMGHFHFITSYGSLDQRAFKARAGWAGGPQGHSGRKQPGCITMCSCLKIERALTLNWYCSF